MIRDSRPLILFCPFGFRQSIPSPSFRHDAEDSIPYFQHAPISHEVFLPIFPFSLSLPFSSFAYPVPFCNLADPEHHPSAGIHNERTRERTNFESGCPKGRKSSGRGRRVKGRKNIPKSSVESSIHWLQMIFSPSILHH